MRSAGGAEPYTVEPALADWLVTEVYVQCCIVFLSRDHYAWALCLSICHPISSSLWSTEKICRVLRCEICNQQDMMNSKKPVSDICQEIRTRDIGWIIIVWLCCIGFTRYCGLTCVAQDSVGAPPAVRAAQTGSGSDLDIIPVRLTE